MSLNHQEQKKEEQMPEEEESGSDVESKEKPDEKGKMITSHFGSVTSCFINTNKSDHFARYNTRLHLHPFTEGEKHPPKTLAEFGSLFF